MTPATLCRFQALSSPLLVRMPIPPKGVLVNRPYSRGLFPSRQIGIVGFNPMATAIGRRAMMGLVVVGFSTFNSASSSSSSSSAAAGASNEEAFLRKTISSHDVVIFSKSYCPYCQVVKDVFKELDEVPHVIELDETECGDDIQDAIYDFVGRRTVPQVFIKGKHIGGSDDTIDAYQNGSLAKLLGGESP